MNIVENISNKLLYYNELDKILSVSFEKSLNIVF